MKIGLIICIIVIVLLLVGMLWQTSNLNNCKSDLTTVAKGYNVFVSGAQPKLLDTQLNELYVDPTKGFLSMTSGGPAI